MSSTPEPELNVAVAAPVSTAAATADGAAPSPPLGPETRRMSSRSSICRSNSKKPPGTRSNSGNSSNGSKRSVLRSSSRCSNLSGSSSPVSPARSSRSSSCRSVQLNSPRSNYRQRNSMELATPCSSNCTSRSGSGSDPVSEDGSSRSAIERQQHQRLLHAIDEAERLASDTLDAMQGQRQHQHHHQLPQQEVWLPALDSSWNIHDHLRSLRDFKGKS